MVPEFFMFGNFLKLGYFVTDMIVAKSMQNKWNNFCYNNFVTFSGKWMADSCGVVALFNSSMISTIYILGLSSNFYPFFMA